MIYFNSFDELADDTKRKITSFCSYSSKYLSRYDSIVKLIGKHMKTKGVVYSPDIANKWVKDFIESNGYSDSTRWRYSRTVNILNSNWNGELNDYKIYTAVFKLTPNSEVFNKSVASFEEFMRSEDKAEKTIYVRTFCANQFLYWVENKGIFKFEDITPLLVSNYLSSDHFQNRTSSGVSTEIIGLRKFLEYLEDKEILKITCHSACLSRKNSTRRIVTVYSDKQAKQLFTPLPKSLSNLRNKAIFMLALKCGLRSCDIMELKFENIDFNSKRLSFIQKKTKVPVIIPFDTEVSNALIDYILHERKKFESDYLFLTVKGPTRKLTHTSSFRTEYHFTDDDKLVCGGIHILRRTYASRLLTAGVNVSAIAATLGHSGLKSVDKYLSTDEEKMRSCALSIKDFPYKGGLF